MEFPNTGVQCSKEDCKLLDFLPFTCSYCSNIFCKEHFHIAYHSCSKSTDNSALRDRRTITFTCSQELCAEKSSVEMLCIQCQRHFCLLHRHHGCLEQNQEKKLEELQKWKNPEQEFSKAKTTIDKEINNKLRNCKNSAMANKIQLLRLKGQSEGPLSISPIHRCYFLVHRPLGATANPKGVFVSVSWTIGKVIDSIADTLKIPNANNIANMKKLRMFDFSTGNIIANQMDIYLSELLEKNNLFNGQHIILEYSNDNSVDCSSYG